MSVKKTLLNQIKQICDQNNGICEMKTNQSNLPLQQLVESNNIAIIKSNRVNRHEFLLTIKVKDKAYRYLDKYN